MATELKRNHHRLAWMLGALVIVAIVGIFSARPEASTAWVAECGAYLTGDETYILVADLNGCEETALTVVGPAKLVLNGHSVSCAPELDGSVKDGTIGILVEGHDGDVLGSGKLTPRTNANTVTGCQQGIVLNGDGDHRVQGVTVTRSTDGAFVVESDENKLFSNVVRQALPWANSDVIEHIGFLVAGNKNLLVANVAADVESEDGGAGFAIEGDSNIVEHNISKDNVAYGYLVSGAENVLNDNTALKNEWHGFFVGVEAEGNLLKHNNSFENGDEPGIEIAASGFHIEGSNNKLEENLATRNGINGIHLTATAADNVTSRNTASDNFGFIGLQGGLPVGTGFDLVDDNFDCGSNKWYLNVFGVRSQSCIK
jgi:parallel beta-helix repeat protein